MSASHLVVFPSQGDRESPADRIRRLQVEARELAHEHLELLANSLVEVSRLAEEVSEGGEIYPVGAREFARRLADETTKHAFTLSGIVERA
ncbi:MAG TPA: hypothetical protein VGL58_20165 [Caulobacteraceae bacterium]|jgi:hypothetical protein